MERRSDRHSPRLDDELHKEIEPLERGAPVGGRGEEFRDPESGDAGTPEGSIEERSDLARFLRPSAFPGDRATLLETAREEQAPTAILRTLEGLPEGRSFENVQDVWTALGGRTGS